MLKKFQGAVIAHQQHISASEPDIVNQLPRVLLQGELEKLHGALVTSLLTQFFANHEIRRREIGALSKCPLPKYDRTFAVATQCRDEPRQIEDIRISRRQRTG